jgi:hypothetical protein
MTERHAELDAAIERVIVAARAHLTAVKAADGRADDDEVWQAYVDLNNASCEYDELMLDMFGEVTPWDVEPIDPEGADRHFGADADVVGGDDPHPHVISVRQRRDYQVPSVTALLRVAEAARRSGSVADEPPEALDSVGEAVLELIQAGDGSLGALDIPELESLDGVVIVAEVESGLNPEEYADADAAGPFELAAGDRVVDRLDEHAYINLDDDDTLDDAEDMDDAEGKDSLR